MQARVGFALVGSVLLLAPAVAAQQAPASSAAPPASSAAPPASAAAPAAPEDGGRFRFGINPTVGLERVSASGASVSGVMYGADMRLGWQINNLLGIYAQPHLSFGSLSTTAGGVPISGGTGTFVVTAMAEGTFIDRIFVGAGGGYGVLNNPSGFTFEARAGGYPLMGKGKDGIRRKGLMIGGDFRSVFVSGATGILIMACVGYEAF